MLVEVLREQRVFCLRTWVTQVGLFREEMRGKGLGLLERPNLGWISEARTWICLRALLPHTLEAQIIFHGTREVPGFAIVEGL